MGADRNLDPNAQNNDTYLRGLAYIAGAEASIFRYGWQTTAEIILFCTGNSQLYEDGKNISGRPLSTLESEKINNSRTRRTNERFPRIRLPFRYRRYLPW